MQEQGKRNASQAGGRPPISALTYAFSIRPDRGRTTDDSDLRIIALALALAFRAARGEHERSRPEPRKTGLISETASRNSSREPAAASGNVVHPMDNTNHAASKRRQPQW
jgi:hypothetical protein